MRTLGIFGSASVGLSFNTTPKASEFTQKVKASFRTLALVRPRLGDMLRNLLYAEDFTMPTSLAIIIDEYFVKFYEMKNEFLYKGNPPADLQTLDLQNIRLALKLAVLQRN